MADLINRNDVDLLNRAEFSRIYFTTSNRLNLSDYSLIATLRALLHNRLPSLIDEDGYYFNIGILGRDYTSNYAKNYLANSREYLVNDVFIESGEFRLKILLMNNDTLEEIKDDLANNTCDYKVDETYELYFKQHKLNSRILIRTDINDLTEAQFYIEDRLATTNKALALVGSLIPVIYSEHFQEKQLTSEETELIKALSNYDYSTFVPMLKSKIEELSIGVLDDLLKGFKQKSSAVRIARIENQIRETNARIQNLLNQLADQYRARERNEIFYKDYITRGEKINTDDIKSFIESSKSIVVYDITNTGVWHVGIDTVLSNFDPDTYEAYSNTMASPLFRDTDQAQAIRRKKLYDKIFLTGEVKLHISARVKFTCGDDYICASIHREDNCGLPSNTVPNPHIMGYDCFGNNARYIVDALSHEDIIEALSYIISAVSNLNFGDGVVLTEFVSYLFSNRYKCLEYKTELLTAKELMEILDNE